jgi:nitrite reductase/ring-hydroxylating ferredoxin subunit
LKETFLTRPYSAYHYSRPAPQTDLELMQTGPGTPCGEYLRTAWQPVALASDLTDVPKRIRILGEDLVIFRDRSGEVGLLQMACSHRGTSLEFGIIADHGIRCCYHGWHYAVDGTILDIPSEPEGTLKNRLCHGAYPTYEFRGLIFAYMGPPEQKPEFSHLDTWDMPGYTSVPGPRHYLPCNWLQVRENNMDPVHTAFLHTIVSGAQFTEQFGVVPELDFRETPIGMVYSATRRVGEMVWVRITEIILPNMNQTPPYWETADSEKAGVPPMLTAWVVPVDDTNTVRFILLHVKDGFGPGLERVVATLNFEIDENRTPEDRQRVPGDYEAQVGQGEIANHDREHLVASDRGVIMYRKLVRRGIRAVESGQVPSTWATQTQSPIPTYSRDTVLRLSAGKDMESDRELLHAAAEDVFASPLTRSFDRIS